MIQETFPIIVSGAEVLMIAYPADPCGERIIDEWFMIE